MVTFTVPKMLRPYFLHHRELLGKLSRAAWETVRDLMKDAVDEKGFRTAMVASVHSAGDFLGWHPHIHALVPRGGWLANGEWMPVPYLNASSRREAVSSQGLGLFEKRGSHQ